MICNHFLSVIITVTLKPLGHLCIEDHKFIKKKVPVILLNS